MLRGWGVLTLACVAACSISFPAATLRGAERTTGPPSVDDFSQLPDIRDVRLNPAGTLLAIVRLGPDGRYRGEIRDARNLATGGLSFDAEPAEIRSAIWLTDTMLLVQLRERRKQGAVVDWLDLFAIFDSQGKLVRRLPSNAPQVLSQLADDPNILLLAYDGDGDRSQDVYRYDIRTGKSQRILRGSNRRGGFIVDRKGDVRVSVVYDPSSYSVTYEGRSSTASPWQELNTLSPTKRDLWRPLGFFTDDPDELVVLTASGADTAGLYVYSLSKRTIVRSLFQRSDVDVDDVIVSRDGRLIGARYTTDRTHIEWFDPSMRIAAKGIEAALPDRTIYMSDRTSAGTALIRSTGPTDPMSYFLRQPDGRLQPLGSGYPQFDGKKLAGVELIAIPARDGTSIPVYLTGARTGEAPRPLVVMPHGGPWARDRGGFDEWAQMLAAQGYIVAQPEFRGSTGFGKKHWLAGDRQWGLAMQTDLDDVARALTVSGKAQAARVAMFGWSYGGYAALIASYRGAGIYRCTVAGAGVSDLNRVSALLSDSPVARLVQRPTIAGLSPIEGLATASVPVLLIHGDRDTVVDVSHSREAVSVLKQANRPFKYVEIRDMDHYSDRMTVSMKSQLNHALVSWLGDCLLH